MANKLSTLKTRGKFKREINAALFNDSAIKTMLLGDTKGKSAREIRNMFKEHVKSHLFIDNTITDTSSYIFYDVMIPRVHTSVKGCQIHMYAVCHRDILDDYEQEGYYGNRADILSEMIEDCLVYNEEIAREFGIGEIKLNTMDVYNSTTLYGYRMVFGIEDFR